MGIRLLGRELEIEMNTVLHLSGHMGGGVGKVLSGVALNDKKYQHDFILLGDDRDSQFSDKCLKHGINVKYTTDISYIRDAVSDADIVHMDWWHYPYLCQVMHDISDLDMRLVVWSHISGCYFPYITPAFVNLPTEFIFTSHYSKENPFWKHREFVNMRNTLVVNSSGGFANTKDVPLIPHEGFNVGYLGTIKYIKLNPHFVDFCAGIADIPGIKFIMIGTIPEPNRILIEAKERGMDHLFEFVGHVPNVSTELARIDVLGYPLNPYSYVTSENALLEAMSMGIPPVCLNQGAEKHLVRNRDTGFLVESKCEYATVIGSLFQDKMLRKRIGVSARNYVLTNLNVTNTVEKLNGAYDWLMVWGKRKYDFDAAIGDTPYKWYQSGIPPCGIDEVLPHLYDDSKSSILQWHKQFPDDKDITEDAAWTNL
jgi:L-malate glycosyltransferase